MTYVQLILVLLLGLHQAMASLNPYISEFEYSPEFHPSRNPSCPRRWARGTWNERRSPEEGGPVGQEPSIEIRAVLVRCPNSHEEMMEVPMGTGNAYNITAGRSQDILEFHGFDRDEPSRHSDIRNCRRKLIVTMKFNNIGKTRTREEFVVVDHVLDPVTMHKARLLNPFVFKVRQEQVLQLYGLKFQSVVNGEAKEEVINKKSSNYTGCDDSLVNPTCGQMTFEGKPIPYSQGFCCSCDPNVNMARQPSDKKSETLSLGTLQKIMPDRNDKQISGFAPLFASSKFSTEEPSFLKDHLETRIQSLRRSMSPSKRERSLKSSQIQTGLSEDDEELLVDRRPAYSKDNQDFLKNKISDKNEEGIHFQEDYPPVVDFLDNNASPALTAAFSMRNPSKGKIEAYIDAVRHQGNQIREEKIIEEESKGVSSMKENVDGDVSGVPNRSELREKFPDHKPLEEQFRNSDLTSELVKLEEEYEAIKKSRTKIGAREVTRTENDTRGIFKNRSKCKNFRKLAQGPDFFSVSLRKTANDEEKGVQGSEETSPESNEHDTKRRISSLTDNNESSKSVSSGSSTLISTSTTPVTASNLSPKSGPVITTISSNNTEPISTPNPTLILRQELVNDELVDTENLLKSSASNSAQMKSDGLYSENSGPSGSSENLKSKDRYADWVIKYGKMHDNRYINSQLKEIPIQKSDLDLNPESSTDSELFKWPQDTLNHIADKVLKEFESAEINASPNHEKVEEEMLQGPAVDASVSLEISNNPVIVDSSENLRNPSQLNSVMTRDAEEFQKAASSESGTVRVNAGQENVRNSSKTWQEILSSKIEDPNEVKPLEKLSKKSSERNSIIKDAGNLRSAKNRGQESGKKTIEPATIIRGSGDMVKGNFRYEDHSATVIADRRTDKTETGSKQDDYIFLDANGKDERPKSLSKLRKRLKSETSNEPGVHLTEKGARGDSMREKFNRLDTLVRDSLRSRRRSFRSIAYDDPFHHGNDEKQAKIDRQIEKEFVEITEALKESSDSRKNAEIFLRSDRSKGYPMPREFAVMLNKIPENDVPETAVKVEETRNEIEKLKNSRKRKDGSQHHETSQDAFDSAEKIDTKESFVIMNRLGQPEASPRKGIARVGMEESQTNMNEIVKQIIKNDYRPSGSWTGKQEHREKGGHIATGNSIFSMKGISHGLHVGKLEKKCHSSSITPFLLDDEKDAGQTLPPDESTVAIATPGENGEVKTTVAEAMVTKAQETDVNGDVGSEGIFQNIENTSPTTLSNFDTNKQSPEETVPEKNSPTTSVPPISTDTITKTGTPHTTKLPIQRHDSGDVDPETAETEISIIPSGLSTVPTTTGSQEGNAGSKMNQKIIGYLSSSGIINGLKNKLQEEKKKSEGYSDLHVVMERSPIDVGSEEITGMDATTWIQDVDNDSDDIFTISTKQFSTVEKSINKENERNGETMGNDGENDEMMPTTITFNATSDEGDSGQDDGAVTNSEEDTTEPSSDEILTVFQQSTNSNEESVTKSWITRIDEPETFAQEVTTESKKSTIPENGSLPCSQTPKTIDKILQSNKTGESSILLVKTYSVSQDPREFLDNYEFPVGVKKILLKKLNVTALIPDPVNFENDDAFVQKVKKLLTNEEEDADYSKIHRENIQIPNPVDDEKKKINPNGMVFEKISMARYRRTIHEANANDSTLRKSRLDNGENVRAKKFQKSDDDAGVDLDPTANRVGEKADGIRRTKNKIVRNYGLKLTRASAIVDTSSPANERNHLYRKDDVNATNFQPNYVMEEPTLPQGKSVTKNGNIDDELKYEKLSKGGDLNRDVDFFYDYDSDSNGNEVKRFYRPSEIRGEASNAKMIEHHANIPQDERSGKPDAELGDKVERRPERRTRTGCRRLKKREIKEKSKELVKLRNSVLAEDEIPGIIEESRCDDAKWQEKIDFLKLKKHQDTLKEYLNWSPNVDTTVMRIFSLHSTPGVSPMSPNSLAKSTNSQDSSTMSILLIEDEGKKHHEESSKNVEDKDILEKLSKTPIGDNLMIISVNEKQTKKKKMNELNVTESAKRFVTKKHQSAKSVKLDGDIRQRKNISFIHREARTTESWKGPSGRRLMSAVQLSENKDNGLRYEDNVPEEMEEVVEKGSEEVASEYQNPVPRGDTSNFDYLDTSYKKCKRNRLNSNREQLVDKIIVNNKNKDPCFEKRNSDKQLSQIPIGSDKSAMEKLHFFDADKYIKLMAEKISRLNNADRIEQNLAPVKEDNEKNSSRSSEYSDEMNDIKVDDDAAAFAEDDERRIREDPVADYEEVIPREMGKKLSRGEFFGKLGSDFEISISGKLHINGESENQPMSINIEGVSVNNASSGSNGVRKNTPSSLTQTRARGDKTETDLRLRKADHPYFDNGDLGRVLLEEIPATGRDGKRKFLGEAGAIVPPKITSIRSNGEIVVAEKNKASSRVAVPRKTFYNVVVRAHPRYEKLPGHSTREYNDGEESSEDFNDDDTEAVNEREKGRENFMDDQPVFDFAKLELRHAKPSTKNNLEDDAPEFLDRMALDDEVKDSSSRKLRQERDMARGEPEEAAGLINVGSDESLPDIKLVKLIPVDLINDNKRSSIELKQRDSYAGKPIDFITSELPDSKRNKIKPIEHTLKNVNLESIVPIALNKNLKGQSGDHDDSSRFQKSDKADVSAVKDEKHSGKAQRITSDLLKSVQGEASKNTDLSTLENSLDGRDSKMLEPGKTISGTGLLKYISKVTEPCYGEKPMVRVLDKPGNLTEKNSSPSSSTVTNFEPTRFREDKKKVRLSVDDLRSSSFDPMAKTSEILIKGVKISSPGEGPRDSGKEEDDTDATACSAGKCEVYDDPQDSRKAIELKNLMTMMSFVKQLENVLSGSEKEAETSEESPEPETVVEVQSVLLVPHDSTKILPDEDDKIEKLRTTSERVVEIGEGVNHNRKHRHRVRGGNLDIVRLGDSKRFESLSLGKDVDKNSDPVSSTSQTTAKRDKTKPFVSQDQTTSEPAISALEESQNYEPIADGMKNAEEKPENATTIEAALSQKMREKIKQRLSDLKKKASRTLRKNLYRSTNKGMDVRDLDNQRSLQDHLLIRSNSDKSPEVRSDDALNLLLGNHLGGKSTLSLRKASGDRENVPESPRVVVRPVKLEEALSKPSNDRHKKHDIQLSESREIGDTPDQENHPLDPKKKERRDTTLPRQDRQARSETGAKRLGDMDKRLPSMENGVVIHKEKRRIKEGSKITDNRNRSKRRRKKKKKNKKKKKKKKWWPFKRDLLSILEDEEFPTTWANFGEKEETSKTRDDPEGRTRKGKSKDRRYKRQIKGGGTQIRGGQDCMDRKHPAHVNSAKYQESAHCLRFSDLWYSVYELETPIMEHTVYLQLFEKHTLPDGSTHWDDLTQGSMVRLGSFVKHQRDSTPTISFTYNGAKVGPQKQSHNLDPTKDRLLIPSPVAVEKLSKYPEVEGGSGEYLVVESNAINKEGNECDKAGVGFSTFATQPNRCGHPKGTCLKNQPLAYWRHDVEAREAGSPGCYFLSNFASVPNNPIKYNVSGSGSREYLGLEYHSPHVSAIDIEVRADYNAIVRVGSSGRVTEVYVDSTASEHTVVTIVVSNMGLASSPYQSRISDCPTGLPVSWSRAKGAMQVIPPQHDQRITLDLYGQLFVDDFHCSVEVVNHRGELVAMRRIRVQKMDRCFCVWHCLCACIGSVAGLECLPMSPEHYHAAGFQGPVPVISMEQSAMANAIKDVMMLSGLIIVTLLILGMLKWAIGIFSPVIGRWGLDLVFAGTQMVGYFEADLRCRSLVTDLEGRIVHPDTGKKSVRICNRRSEFFLNLTFFLTYPIAVCCKCARSSLRNRGKRNCCQDESKVCLLKDEASPRDCGKFISVNTYGDNRDSKMEAEDTRYVMKELKRSQDSLQDGMGKRSKIQGLRNRK